MCLRMGDIMLERSSIVNSLGGAVFDPITEAWEYRPAIGAGLPMTICIAALCDQSRTIVIAADKMVGSPFIEADTRINKVQPIHGQWITMFSCDDASSIEDILRSARDNLATIKDPTQSDARNALTAAYAAVRLRKAESTFLVGRSFTLQRFIAEGRSLLGDQLFAQIERQIASFDLGVEFLVAGHHAGYGYIFSVLNPGRDTAYSIPGFHAIGSGELNALSSLSQRGVDPVMYLAKTLYFVYEAKRYAELVGGVGETSDIFILRADRKEQVSEEVLKELDAIWKEVKPKDVDLDRVANLQATKQIQGYGPWKVNV